MAWEATAPRWSRRSYPGTRVGQIVQSHSFLTKAEVCLIFLLTAITDYIRVARRKRASVGTARSKPWKVKIDPATPELDSQLMVSFCTCFQARFFKRYY